MTLNRPENFQEKQITFERADGPMLYVDVIGRGPALLCYAGFACSNYNFIPMVEYLQQHFTLYLLDNRGFGKSGPARNEYHFDQLALDGIYVMEQLGIEKYHIAGISMGGFIAQRHALIKPETILSLHLLSTKSSGPEYPVTGEVTEESFTQFTQMDPEVGNRFAIEAFVHPVFKGSDECEKIIKLRRENNPIELEQALIQLRASWNFLSTPCRIDQISAPTLIIHGADDLFLTPENGKILHRNIPNSQLELMENSAHLFFFEKPQAVAEKMINFVGEM